MGGPAAVITGAFAERWGVIRPWGRCFSPMPSDAETFEATFESFKEFVDDDGHHFYIIQFDDDSGRIFRKQPSEDERSTAEFTIRDRFAMEGMRRIASATDFEVDKDTNTQQNLRNLMEGDEGPE